MRLQFGNERRGGGGGRGDGFGAGGPRGGLRGGGGGRGGLRAGAGRWSGGDDADGERGQRGRGRRMFDAGALRLILLKLLSETPRHGYDLIRAIEERSGGGYVPSPGVVYPTLTMLDDMKLIDEQRSEGARRLFAINAAGEAHLAERAAEVDALFVRLAALGERANPGREAPVRRAMMNLRAVLQHRLSRDGVDEAMLHEVAALIDATAQQIERL